MSPPLGSRANNAMLRSMTAGSRTSSVVNSTRSKEAAP
jgi:hypothetical protein